MEDRDFRRKWQRFQGGPKIINNRNLTLRSKIFRPPLISQFHGNPRFWFSRRCGQMPCFLIKRRVVMELPDKNQAVPLGKNICFHSDLTDHAVLSVGTFDAENRKIIRYDLNGMCARELGEIFNVFCAFSHVFGAFSRSRARFPRFLRVFRIFPPLSFIF